MRSRAFVSPLVSGVLALVLLWAGYSAWFFLANGDRHALVPIDVPTLGWEVIEGGGRTDRNAIELDRPGRYGQTRAAARLAQPLPADRLGRLHVEIEQPGDVLEMSVGVSGSSDLSRLYSAPLVVDRGNRAVVESGELHLGIDEIRYLVISVRGGLREPFVVRRVQIGQARPGFGEFQRMLWASLIETGDWTQRSINQVRFERSPLRVSPVVAVALWIGLTLLLVVALPIPGGRRPGVLALVAGLMAAGWFLLDAGWQARLLANHVDAVRQFGGKGVQERRQAGGDGRVFEFIEDLKAAVDDPMRRMVIIGDIGFTHFRARYFAVPHPVISRRGVSWAWLRRAPPGTVFAFVHERDAVDAVPLRTNEQEQSAPVVELSPEEIAGRDASVVPGPDADSEEMLRLDGDSRPWLVQSGWRDQPAGLWRLWLDAGATEQDGWIRIEVFRRGPEETRQRLAWREVFVRAGEPLGAVSLPFPLGAGEQVLFRVRELSARGSMAGGVRVESVSAEPGMVLLSPDGSPPYWLARKLIEADVGVAYELL